MHAKEITRRYQDKNVIGIALHPGAIVETDLARHMDFWYVMSIIYRIFIRSGAFWLVLGERNKNTAEGVSTSLVCALDPGVVAGGYYFDCNLSTGKGMHVKANDSELASKLWDFSEELIKGAKANNN